MIRRCAKGEDRWANKRRELGVCKEEQKSPDENAAEETKHLIEFPSCLFSKTINSRCIDLAITSRDRVAEGADSPKNNP